MFKDKPIISNQYGALVMAFVPYFYALFTTGFSLTQFWLGISWLFLYLFSYPFFAIFNKKNSQRYKKWAIIYFVISLIFAIPVFLYDWTILQFSLPILPLALIQIYFAKQKNERHLANDIVGILTFGVIGMATIYIATQQYHWEILLHPTLFFVATTLYVKSVARERRNPLYLKLSIYAHIILILAYAKLGLIGISIAYLVGLVRASLVPKMNLNIKQIGMIEFGIVAVFLVGLYFA
ncbi:hypothetical protein A1D22_06860 [Pasteurellaceae bacterium LFhippo2]|nr:hypothetical protein [Pasteurellaceae bacterium LFhippo2]